MEQQTTGKRLAKNTAFMYARMIVLMLISLYTSRVVLRELGVEDYGIYNVVGSVVAMFGAMRSMFATSTQRFINFEMGKGNRDRLRVVFNMGTYINLALAAIFVIGVEIVGWWFFTYQINIDPCRLVAAKWVFQLSVISGVISMMTTPYDAVIIAHERMDFYAIMAIIEGVLRLLIVFMLAFFPFDKLIFYASLQLMVSFIIRFANALYCSKRFPESHYKRCWDKALFKEMFVFAGWNFFGNMAFTLTDSGLNMVLNVFGGVTVNAARGVAYQVKNATMKFMDAMTTVVSPYNTKIYAAGHNERFFDMLHLSSKVYFMVQLCLVVPLTYFTREVLFLWLKQVPDYSVIFTQLVLVHTLIRSIHYPINNLFKSVGNLKTYQITEGIVLALPLLFSYFALKEGYPYYYLFVIVILFEAINFILILFIARKVAGLSIRQYTVRTALPCLICLAVGVVGYIISSSFLTSPWMKFAFSIVIMLVCITIMFLIGLSGWERRQLLSIIKKNN